MPTFAIRHPYFIIVVCLFICVLGVTSLAQMPVDMFPPINIPVVLVATFYNGMPPEQIEADITDTFERFFTLASGIDHIESRSMAGVSLIKIYFQPGTDANADVTNISNLAMADLRRLPEGTLPPVVLKVDASSLPVCLLTVDGKALMRRSFTTSAISDPQPDRGRSRRNGTSALRRQVPADHGVRGSVETAGARVEPDGRGARDERVQPDSAGRRRAASGRWITTFTPMRKCPTPTS